MSGLDAALEQWNAAIAQKNQLVQSMSGHADTAENVTRWLHELTKIKSRLVSSSTSAIALMSPDMRVNFTAIAHQVLANVEKALTAMHHTIANFN